MPGAREQQGGLPKLLWLSRLSNICCFSCGCINSMGQSILESAVAPGESFISAQKTVAVESQASFFPLIVK